MDKHNRNNIAVGRSVGIIFLVISVIAIAVGVYLGEAQTVLQKATLICLECIGLG